LQFAKLLSGLNDVFQIIGVIFWYFSWDICSTIRHRLPIWDGIP